MTTTKTNSLHGKRILFVISDFALGGSERQAIEAASYFQDHCGAQVEVWGFESHGGASDLATSLGIRCRRIQHPTRGGIRNIRSLFRFTKQLCDWNPDAVLSYTMSANIACGLALRLHRRIPLIWNQRDIGIHRGPRWAERVAVRRAHAWISNGKHGAEFLHSDLKIPSGHIQIIPNGTKLQGPKKDTAQWRKELRVEPSDLIVLMIGHLSTRKSHEFVLKSWAKTEMGHAKLVCAGRDDGTLANLQKLAKKLAITDSVRFPGFVEDISGLLNTTSVLVHAAPSEGCPNAVIEGLNAGLPLVLSDTPGVNGMVPSGRGCWLCADTDSMSRALTHMIRLQPNERDAIAKIHKKIAREQFDANKSFFELNRAVANLVHPKHYSSDSVASKNQN